MAAAVAGIVLWALTDDPNLAILFALVADLLAGLPTVIKSYRHPETESWIAYAISTLGFGMGVLAIQTFTFENYAFIGYLFLLNGLLALLASRKYHRHCPSSHRYSAQPKTTSSRTQADTPSTSVCPMDRNAAAASGTWPDGVGGRRRLDLGRSSDLGPLSQNPILALCYPLFGGKKVMFPIPRQDKDMARHFKDFIESGQFKPVIDRMYPLDQIVEAYRYVETGQKIGNVVISVVPSN